MTGGLPPVRDIDHLMVHVHDVEAAGQRFEALGFTVTPKSSMAALGLSNRCVLFQPANDHCCNYIELMAMEDPGRVPSFMHDVLGTAEGPVSLVMATPDARAAADDFAARGVPCHPPFDVQRDWHLGDGIDVQVAFGVCMPEAGRAPLYWNLCEHRTRQHYVRPDITTHANGARRIAGVEAVASDPLQVARVLGADWSTPVRQDAADACHLRPGDVTLSISRDRGASEPAIVALGLEELSPESATTLFGLELRRA